MQAERRLAFHWESRLEFHFRQHLAPCVEGMCGEGYLLDPSFEHVTRSLSACNLWVISISLFYRGFLGLDDPH